MRSILNLSAISCYLFAICYSTFAQGSLTPPGAPAPMMKTLSQIEPRTPISSVPYTISTPGAYYLTTNVTATASNAIVIAANGVMLDLNGFTILSTVVNASNSGSAILISSGCRNLTIQNGFIDSGVTNNGSGVYSGTGFGYGIRYSGNPPANVCVSRVSVAGVLYQGIYLGSQLSTLIESCTVRTAGTYGLCASSVNGSIALDCGSIAVSGYQISHCRGESVSGDAISAQYIADACYGTTSANGNGISAVVAVNCYGSSPASGNGVSASTAANCYGTGGGVVATTAANCYGYGAANASGVSALTVENCYGQNASTGYGIQASFIATGCYGYSYSGTAVSALIGNVCHGVTVLGVSSNITHNVNCY